MNEMYILHCNLFRNIHLILIHFLLYSHCLFHLYIGYFIVVFRTMLLLIYCHSLCYAFVTLLHFAPHFEIMFLYRLLSLRMWTHYFVVFSLVVARLH